MEIFYHKSFGHLNFVDEYILSNGDHESQDYNFVTFVFDFFFSW